MYIILNESICSCDWFKSFLYYRKYPCSFKSIIRDLQQQKTPHTQKKQNFINKEKKPTKPGYVCLRINLIELYFPVTALVC